MRKQPEFETMTNPVRVRDDEGRAYEVIGFVIHPDGTPQAVLIPDAVCLGEPLPTVAERAQRPKRYTPEDM